MRNGNSIFSAAMVVMAACAGGVDDSMYVTGSESDALVMNGVPTCAGPKVLVCHIPPGNPANAHEICVGAPAVGPHQRLHGDLIGACGAVDGGAGGGAGGAGGAGGGGIAVCSAIGAACSTASDCCDGAGCESGVCVPIIP